MKVKQESVFTVDYNDLDKAIQKHFGRPEYECVADEEWNNYSAYDFNVDGKLDDWDMKKLAGWITTGKNTPSVRTILNKMCSDSAIQAGKYIVKVFW